MRTHFLPPHCILKANNSICFLPELYDLTLTQSLEHGLEYAEEFEIFDTLYIAGVLSEDGGP